MSYEYKGVDIKDLPAHLAEGLQKIDDIGHQYGNFNITVRDLMGYIHDKDLPNKFNGYSDVFVFVGDQLRTWCSLRNGEIYTVGLVHGRLSQREEQEIEQALGLIVSRDLGKSDISHEERRMPVNGHAYFLGDCLEKITSDKIKRFPGLIRYGDGAVYYGREKPREKPFNQIIDTLYLGDMLGKTLTTRTEHN